MAAASAQLVAGLPAAHFSFFPTHHPPAGRFRYRTVDRPGQGESRDSAQGFSVREGPAFGPVGESSVARPLQRSHSSRYGFRQPYLGWERSCGGLPTALGSLSPHPNSLMYGEGTIADTPVSTCAGKP